MGLKNMWQSHPASLEVRNATQTAADIRVWLWSPDAPAMDLRHYDTKAHDLDSSYEDVQQGFSTPHGVARTSELTLFPTAAVPGNEDVAAQAKIAQQPPLLLASPQYIHSAKVFGIWSLPDRSTPARTAIEDHLDAAFSLYHKEVDQRHWYGFWNYGDVMHQHDGPRHSWRYDVGGFAWDNTELGTDVWLWYNFLRTGRADAFRMAEAITRHTSEVDVYHLGRFAGLGSRHNVRHWGDGAKESRISQAAYRRFYYYLTGDERTGDLMRAVVDVDYKLLETRPHAARLAAEDADSLPRPRPRRPRLAGLRRQLDDRMGAHRRYEISRQDHCRDGLDCGHALRISFRPEPALRLRSEDRQNGRDRAGWLRRLQPDDDHGRRGSGLRTERSDRPSRLAQSLARIRHAGACTEGDCGEGSRGRRRNGRRGRPVCAIRRLVAYAYRDTKNPALAKKAWSLVRVPTYATTHFDPPAVLNPIDEIPGLSTNSVSQGCLEAIEVLEMCGDQLG